MSQAPIVSHMTNQIAVLDRMFHALADPSRRSMIERLSKGTATVSDLAAPLEMALPTVLQHLRVLEDSGLVRSTKAGRVRTCALDTAALREAERWITSRRAMWENRLDRLGDFLEASSKSTNAGE